MGDAWYVSRAGQVFGPYSWERVLEFAHDGSIGADDHVMRPGSTEWVLADTVPAFASQAAGVGVQAEALDPPSATLNSIPPVPPAVTSASPGVVAQARASRSPVQRRARRVFMAVVLMLAIGAAVVVLVPGVLARRGTFTPPTPGHVIETKAYGSVEANRVLVSLKDDGTTEDVEQLANELGGTVVGEWGHLGLFLIEFPNKTEAGLATALKTASKAKGVANALPERVEQP